MVRTYIEPAKHLVPEFWEEEKIRLIRRMAETGQPALEGVTPAKVGRILDRAVFKDLRPSDLKEALTKADKLDVDTGIDFFGTRLEIPIYVGDMSFGALSGNPNIAIAKAVTEVGAVAGIGEGGLHPEIAKYRNIVVQWASARFGMDMALLRAGLAVNIKIGQGAKPGIGGHLPGRKVVDIIAQLRKIPVGSEALSPAPHHDIYSIEDLAQRVKALRDLTGKPVLVKVAAVNKIHFVAVGVGRSTAEGIIIDGAGAGTGATPIVARDHLGIPIDYAVPVVDMWLRRDGTRGGLIMIAGGMLYSPMDVAKIVAMGADMANMGTAALMAMGCILCHACHTGGCPTALTNMIGSGKVLDVEWGSRLLANYLTAVGKGLKAILYALGMSSLRELVGRRDLLEVYNVDEKVAETLGLDLAQPGDVAWLDGTARAVVQREYYEEGRPPIIGMGGVVPGYTSPARRPLDLLRIEAAQVTHPSVDPYREELEVDVWIGGERYYTPVVVPAIDEAAVYAAAALGAPIYGGDCRGFRCINEGATVVAPQEAAEVDGGVVVIDETKGGGLLEEAVARLDLQLRRRGTRDRTYIVAVGRLYNGGDIYKLAALGADLVCPLGIFEHVHQRVRNLDLRSRMVKFENVITALTKELRLLMGANGVTNYFHTLVGNRDLLRSLDGKIAQRLGVEVAGR
ncbi:Glutamate synthase (NADPH) [Pyrobaculum neutrophilum V24Sta]|uniref:Archaeal glutamate synthase [NADPH] n=1 Tax=Pyrobaculum neutrophilum (strain DSM 2338 / JCM 9278 / NBRC 100436 / V24Sta) TaxID=444157 RepID=B1YDA3_PYRNV|nr:Glutamate synthase (NADPH) [Pyrobaculum neutrophilum V24Sta]